MVKLVNQTFFASKLKEKKLFLFSVHDLCAIFGVNKVAGASLLTRYRKKGFILQIKRGVYAFPEALPPDVYMANKIYFPSYISLELALSYHGVIPETVYEITSVTTKATRSFKTLGKVFNYHTIKKSAYTGYKIQNQRGLNFYMADAEKAFVDLSYLRIIQNREPIVRFNQNKINFKKVLQYASLFKNAKLITSIKKMIK